MRTLWWEAVFAESSEVVWFQYLTVYLLFLGAGAGLIGALASLTSLASALAAMPGAYLAESTRRYKGIVIAANGASRLVFLLLAVMPWLGGSGLAMAVLVTACLLRGAMSSFAMPAWNALAAGSVPEHTRGRYFAFRNFAKQGTSMALTPLVGLLIGLIGGATGWQLLWLASAGLAFVASACIFVTPPPKRAGASRPEASVPRASLPSLREFLTDSTLVRFVGTTSLFQLSVMIAGPFFSVYLVRHLGASTLWVGLVATASPLSATLCQPLLGRIADRISPAGLLVAANAIILFTPLMWLLAFAPWQVVGINLIGGAAWQANQLGSFNFVLARAPEKRLPSYVAVQQMGMYLVSFAGPLAGGLVIGIAGFRVLFLLSAAGRLVATALQYLLLLDRHPAAAHLSIETTAATHA